MEGAGGDFYDWEILQSPEENSATAPNSPGRNIDSIGSNSSGVIRSDYFAIHHGKKSSEVDLDGGVMKSGNSISFDVVLGSGHEVGEKAVVGGEGTEISRGELAGFVSDSAGGGSGFLKFGEFEAKSNLSLGGDAVRGMGLGGIEVSSGEVGGFLSGSGAADVVSRKVEGYDELGKREVGLGAIGEIGGAPKNSEEFWSDMSTDDGMVLENDKKGELGWEEEENFEGIAIERPETDEFLLDSGRDVPVTGESGFLEGGVQLVDHGDFSKAGDGSASSRVMEAKGEVSDSDDSSKRGVGELSPVPNAAAGEGEKKAVVWWKIPLELLKFCVFRVSPVWSISMAVAVLGIVILRKRLYRLKRKVQSIPLNVSVDEKKVSQVMVRVAHLNEAFSVVRRIPIVRAPVPAAGGVTTWPVMNLR